MRRVIDRLFAPSPSADERIQWGDELVLELLQLESAMARIQLLRKSNASELDRYALEKNRITDRATATRSDIATLKVKLEDAQEAMRAKMEYDVLADRINNNRMLKPREDQLAALDKLSGEIAELEKESLEYKRTWAERREQFGRIVEEGKQMLRLIKDEKEEAERKEGMEGLDDEVRGLPSGAATPYSTMNGETVATPQVEPKSPISELEEGEAKEDEPETMDMS
jgi:Tho complex subunit 7